MKKVVALLILILFIGGCERYYTYRILEDRDYGYVLQYKYHWYERWKDHSRSDPTLERMIAVGEEEKDYWKRIRESNEYRRNRKTVYPK